LSYEKNCTETRKKASQLSQTTSDLKVNSFDAFEHFNVEATSGLLLVCEHASNYIPSEFDNLGLPRKTRQSHIAWDIGAAEFADKLATVLNAGLLKSSVSRLVYDCNRPPEADDAIPEKSEVFEIPGNQNLSTSDREHRAAKVYHPFREYLSGLAKTAKALITIHSFTPIYNGHTRTVEIGVLHDSDTRLADKILEHSALVIDMDVRRNEPYAPSDGVTHTLKVHGLANGIPNVMLEIRNDILSNANLTNELHEQLALVINSSLAELEQNQCEVQ